MKLERLSNRNFLILSIVILSFALSYGCATTKGRSKTLQPIDQGIVLTDYENLEIHTEITDGVEINQGQADRITDYVVTKLTERDPDCFKSISKHCEAASTLLVTVNFTRYKEGSAFARSMLAGLGQMHIDAIVIISDKASDKTIAKHEVTKTFAWGGVYGGSTRIEDIEPAFAEAIVSIILQEES